MAFITKLLGKLLGNKSDRDINEIMPKVEAVKTEYSRITLLDNDQLRDETDRLKALIQESIRAEKEEIEQLKIKVEEVEIQDSEKIYERIDKLEEIRSEERRVG